MTTTISKFMIPPQVNEPRGSLWIADLATAGGGSKPQPLLQRAAAGARQVGGALWRGLQALGRARARHHLLELARSHDRTDPGLARQLRAASRFSGEV